MPRTTRASEAQFTYHVLNRGNARSEVFHKVADYAAFLQIICGASLRLPMPMLAYCRMPNYFHLMVRSLADGDLSRWMQWLLTTHVRRYLAGHRAIDAETALGETPTKRWRVPKMTDLAQLGYTQNG
jgi:putative transposase